MHNFMPRVEPGRLGILLVDRETEFAPVKNANVDSIVPAPDTPAWARRMILAEAQAWLQEAANMQASNSERANLAN